MGFFERLRKFFQEMTERFRKIRKENEYEETPIELRDLKLSDEGHVVVSDEINIDKQEFENADIESIDIPEGETTKEELAEDVSNVTVLDNKEKIIPMTLDKKIVKLLDIKPDENGKLIIPSTVQFPDEIYEIEKLGNSVFEYGMGIVSVEIPEGVTEIGNNAFGTSIYLENVTIPNSVTSIGKMAFASCEKLNNITIPKNVTSIGEIAFADCTSLTEVNWKSPINLSEHLEEIFHNCPNLKTIKYRGREIDITEDMEQNVKALSDFEKHEQEVEESNKRFEEELANRLWEMSAEKHQMGDYVQKNNLTEIVLPSNISEIAPNEFNGCDSLISVTIPDNINKIGNFAFRGCSNLTEITIPESVASIGESAFFDCINLTEITIPKSVTSIENSVFDGCEKLTSITIPEGVTNIGECAFAGCTSLTEITIPEGVKYIEIGTFDNCEGLTNITIPEGVTSIGKCAFRNTGLTEITIPDSVTSIGEWAFLSCNSLSSITIPESVTNIGKWAFMGCENLKEVTWNSPVRLSEERILNIFENCPNLESINYHGTIINLKEKDTNDTLDEIINDASVPKSDEVIESLDNIVKNTENYNL